jgi:putative ABC transport system substrate-binding protein
VKRRDFITLLGGAAAWPLAARAQQSDRIRRIGVLSAFAEQDPEIKARLAAFRTALERLGWSEGRNVRIDYRYAPTAGADLARMLAKELIALQPDVILGQSPPLVAALQRETRAIPIVFVSVSDPIGAGFVASLARPGGNLTGLLVYEESITSKWLAMLKEIDPALARVALVGNRKTTAFDYFLRAATAAAPSVGVELIPEQVVTASDIERVVESFAGMPRSGLVFPPDTTTVLHRDLVIALAAKHHIPAVYAFRFFVTAGGLLSYSIDFVFAYRQAASYVDRILRGSKPADLPVQAPTKFQTVVNLKTAKALGLTVPPGLLVAADEVIE